MKFILIDGALVNLASVVLFKKDKFNGWEVVLSTGRSIFIRQPCQGRAFANFIMASKGIVLDLDEVLEQEKAKVA